MSLTHPSTDADRIRSAADRAGRAIPPVWPLASSVAVNPFLGQAGEGLAVAGARLARVAGARITLPRSWYREQIAAGLIADADLRDAWANAPASLRPADPQAVQAAAVDAEPPAALPTIADLAAEASGIDWPGLIAERLGAWAAAYFDAGQALWAGPRGKGAYAAWKSVATHDLTPEIAGLGGFALYVSEAPDSAPALTARIVDRLGLAPEALETCFHQLLMTWGGWAQVARYRLWQAELAGESDQTVTDFLAIRLLWEEALLLRYEDRIGEAWRAVRAVHATPVTPTPDMVIDTILQEALERATQRRLAATLAAPVPTPVPATAPVLQAAFCIDVRSEVFRRALESLDPGIQTLGFAGFFGLTTAHRRFGSDVEERRLPVLLNPAFRSSASTPSTDTAETGLRVRSRARRAWGRFKLAAVSSFAFVEAAGPLYVGKLLGDALGLKSPPTAVDPVPQFHPSLSLETRVRTAETVLRAMSLTSRFAPLVLLVGHGATVVNNPHASALQCGACGGYSGEVNARLLAQLLNDPDVRWELSSAGIDIPVHTVFVAALHCTTTDDVTLFDLDGVSITHEREVAQARLWLGTAGMLARGERALTLPRATAATLGRRARDWAEVRPEWGLAGCNTFIAAPRMRTAGRDLGGRAFLHDYDWRQDRDFGVLELILTAPVVVASWISLQYYGSTVAPGAFGGGNKLLHNVTGGLGVVEGNGGLLRVGLPWQSVHDGERYVHDPLRLSVCVEAPRQAIADVLRRHDGVRALFDNGWLHLFALDDAGRMAWRYAGDLTWLALEDAGTREVPSSLKLAG
ncbi:MAG: YbcC family protein [Brevundimonas sp.]